MFSKMAIFVFVVLGVFALLFGTMTVEFYANQGTYSASAGADPVIATSFTLANVTMYSNLGNDTMTYQYSSYHDGPDAPDWEYSLPVGQYLEIWWGLETAPSSASYLEFRHTSEVWWGLAFVRMIIWDATGQTYGASGLAVRGITRADLVREWNAESNASIFTTKTPISASYLIQYNQSLYTDIGDAWDNNELAYMLTYEVNLNATSMNIWGVIGALLTFTTPALGLTGTAGLIVNGIIAVPFWIITAILIIKLVQSIIPFIGGTED